jgi:hypothetical protein
MSCQPIAGYEREMFWAGCTMNIGSKKLLREVASTFCGAQGETREFRSMPARFLDVESGGAFRSPVVWKPAPVLRGQSSGRYSQ